MLYRASLYYSWNPKGDVVVVVSSVNIKEVLYKATRGGSGEGGSGWNLDRPTSAEAFKYLAAK